MLDHVDVAPGVPRQALGARVRRVLGGAGVNVLLACLSGFLTALLFPPFEVWWFAWFCLVPLLAALRRTAAIRAAGWLVLGFGLAFSAVALHWLQTIFGGSVIGIFVLMSLPWFLFGLAYRTVVGSAAQWRSRVWAGVAVVAFAAVCWLAVEWIRCEGWYFRFSWMQLGFSFASCRRGGALYPFIGVYGVTFLIMLVNAALVEIAAAKTSLLKRAAGITLCAALVLPLTLYLNAPIGSPLAAGEQTESFRVQVVQSESGSLPELKAQTLRLAQYTPNLIVWPEYAVADYPFDNPKLLGELQEVARSTGSTLVLGTKRRAPANARVDWLRRRAMLMMEGMLYGNIALVIAPDGTVLGEYHKTHPIQFFSDGVPGTSYPTFPTAVGRIGIGICYDFDFASCPLRLVRNGAELFVVPTFDSREWSDVQHNQHARMAQARSAEFGRWTVRATSSGVSQVIAPNGLVTTVIWNGGADTTLGRAVARREMTWYARLGYRLPHACLAVALCWSLWMVAAWGRRRFRRPGVVGPEGTI